MQIFQFSNARLTPHCFRRGGATFHFRYHGNYDRLAEHGRWAQVATARMYVDLAMAEAGSAEFTALGLKKVKVAVGLLPTLMASVQ